ncbi:MAG: AsmA-like C-terminal region-containing protein [Candidatus Melainabacteria bacterium]|nr:AsmA-like C-terminal region-containing protein [Candidatus Melainabacteria bacterium]
MPELPFQKSSSPAQTPDDDWHATAVSSALRRSGPKRRLPSPRQPLFWLLLVLLGTVGTFGGSYLLDALLPLLVDTADLKRKVIAAMESQACLQVEIDSLELHPTLFDGVEVRLKGIQAFEPLQHSSVEKTVASKRADATVHVENLEGAAPAPPIESQRLQIRRGSLYVRMVPLVLQQVPQVGKVTLEDVKLHLPRVPDDPSVACLLASLEKHRRSSRPPEVELKDATIEVMAYQAYLGNALEPKPLQGNTRARRTARATRALGQTARTAQQPVAEHLLFQGEVLRLQHVESHQPTEIDWQGRLYLLSEARQALGTFQASSFKPITQFSLQAAWEPRLLEAAFEPLNTASASTAQPSSPLKDTSFSRQLSSAGWSVQRAERLLKAIRQATLRLDETRLSRLGFELSQRGYLQSSLPGQNPLEGLMKQWVLKMETRQEDARRHPQRQAWTVSAEIDSPFRLRTAGYQLDWEPGTAQFSMETPLPLKRVESLQFKLASRHFELSATGALTLNRRDLWNSLVDVTADSNLFPVAYLGFLPPDHEFRPLLAEMNGKLRLEAVRLKGPVHQPQVLGNVQLDAFSLFPRKQENRPPLIDRLEGRFGLQRHQWMVQGVRGQLDGYGFSMDALYNWHNRRIEGQLAAKPLPFVPLWQALSRLESAFPSAFSVREPLLRQFSLEGEADVDVSWQGTVEKPRLKGGIQIREGGLLWQPSATDPFAVPAHVPAPMSAQQVTPLAPPQAITHSVVRTPGVSSVSENASLKTSSSMQPRSAIGKNMPQALPNASVPRQQLLKSFSGQVHFQGEAIQLSPFQVSVDSFNQLRLNGRFHWPTQQWRLRLAGDFKRLQPLYDRWLLLQPTVDKLSAALPPSRAGLKKKGALLPATAPVKAADAALDGQLRFQAETHGTLKSALPWQQQALRHLQANGSMQAVQCLWRPWKNYGLHQLRGSWQWSHQQLSWSGLSGRLGDSLPFELAGQYQSDRGDYKLQFSSERGNLHRLLQELRQHLPANQLPKMEALADVSGWMSHRLQLVGNVRQKGGLPQLVGHSRFQQLAIVSPQSPQPLRFSQLQIQWLPQHRVQVPKTQGQWGPVPFFINAQAGLPVALSNGQQSDPQHRPSVPLHWQLAAETLPIETALLREQPAFFRSLLTMAAGSPAAWPELWNTAGAFQLKATASSSAVDASLNFDNVGVSARGLPLPVHHLNGTLRWQQSASAPGTVAFSSRLAPGESAPGMLTASPNFRWMYGNAPMHLRQGIWHIHPTLPAGESFRQQASGRPVGQLASQLRVSGRFTPLEVNYGLGNAFFDEPLSLDLEVPFYFRLQGHGPLSVAPPFSHLHHWQGRMVLQTNPMTETDEEAKAALQAEASANHRPAVVVVVEKEKATQASLPQEGYRLAADMRLENNRLALPLTFSAGPMGKMTLEATATQPLQPQKAWLQLHAFANPPLDLSFLNHWYYGKPTESVGALDRISGQISADIRAQGPLHSWMQPAAEALPSADALSKPDVGQHPEKPVAQHANGVNAGNMVAPNQSRWRVEGGMALQNVALPNLKLYGLDATLGLTEALGQLEVSRFEIPGTHVQIKAKVPYGWSWPLQMEDVVIRGKQFYVEGFNEFTGVTLAEQVAKPLEQQLSPKGKHHALEHQGLLPVTFHRADVQLDEVIFSNIILDQVRSRLSVFGNGHAELEQLQFNLAEGHVDGQLSISPNNNNFLMLALKTDSVEANALSRVLLQTSNQIFGRMSGDIQLTTFGKTPDQLMQNVNGLVDFEMKNGRLPAIARVETLLTAANVLRGGLLGLNLNNLFRVMRPFDTNYFANLSGSFQLAEGVAYTSNTHSNGKNLDLDITGSSRVVDGVANMRVQGTMDQNVSGSLGKVGKFSLSSLLEHIPVLGSLPGKRPGLLRYVPGVGYVPLLGGPAKRSNRFQVKIQGPLDDPASVKDFQWTP